MLPLLLLARVCLSQKPILHTNFIIISCYRISQHIIFVSISIFAIRSCLFLHHAKPPINLSQFFLLCIWLVTILTGCHVQLFVICKMVTFFHSKKKHVWIGMLLLISLCRHMTNWITKHVILVCFMNRFSHSLPMLSLLLLLLFRVLFARVCSKFIVHRKKYYFWFFLWLNEKYQTLLALSQSNQVKSDQFLWFHPKTAFTCSSSSIRELMRARSL